MNQKKSLLILILYFCFLIGAVRAQDSGNSGPVTDLVKFCSDKKGFNLLGKFDLSGSNYGFTEKEFSMIHDLGFNFVRLPLDFRTYTPSGNWDIFTETEVLKIDKAVEWGSKYNVHVCINLHRAPGYCVNAATLPVNQQLNLWTDTMAQKAFIKHWEFFTKRYSTISPEKLSFNLVNEPSNVTDSVYVHIMKKAIQAIHAISPNRIIFVDGMDYGSMIIPALKNEINVAQSIHCYTPFGLTHYKAEWAVGSNDWPLPVWPMLWISRYLYGPWKSDFMSPMVIQGNFAKGTKVIVNVNQVSAESTLTIKSGSKVVFSKKFVSGPDPGTDFTTVVKNEWGYTNISNKDFSFILAEASTKLSFENSAGDWMTLNSISLNQGTTGSTYNLSDDTWGGKQSTYLIDETGALKTLEGGDLLPFDIYRKNVALAKEFQIPFMVQEFGVYNKTPHKVVVDFISDLSKFFKDNNIGWALWNFNGSFGILNSDRTDCPYESYQGYLLDRGLLNALIQNGSADAVLKKTQNELKLFPSPVKDLLQFSSVGFKGKTIIKITDMTGQSIKSFSIDSNASGITNMDVSSLNSNMYLLSASNNGKLFTGKFIVSK